MIPTASALKRWAPTAKKVGVWLLLLGLVWPTQYLVVVPAAYILRLTLAAFKVLGVAAILLFIPLIGWVILYFVWRSHARERNAERRHREILAVTTTGATGLPRSLWTPWLLGLVRN